MDWEDFWYWTRLLVFVVLAGAAFWALGQLGVK